MLSVVLALGVRCLLVMLFLPFSALDKILNFHEAVAQARQAFSPPVLALLAVAAGAGIEIVMSVAILGGVADRLAASVLALYCVVTALLWKQFWKLPDFRLRGAGANRDLFWDFLKNLSLAGGFLLLAFGSNAGSVRQFFDNPFASSHPYSRDAR